MALRINDLVLDFSRSRTDAARPDWVPCRKAVGLSHVIPDITSN